MIIYDCLLCHFVVIKKQDKVKNTKYFERIRIVIILR